MDADAAGSIKGSATVAEKGEMLNNKTKEVMDKIAVGDQYHDMMDFIRSQASEIWNNATQVNDKSKSQLEFSINCEKFSDSLIVQSNDLMKATQSLNDQSSENNTMAKSISNKLEGLTRQLNQIEIKIEASDGTIQKFNTDYEQIDKIINFLKNIMKSMNTIGLMARIESSRDPEKYKQFITISENIINLQNHIDKTIPVVEENINKSHELIIIVNENFK
jgi:methyl-accepting chemotaxis protein